ncbi:MAG: hypothetical protein ACE5E2_02420, partial [Candidatus Binatia bacterium]
TDLRPFDGELTAEPWLWGTALAGSPEHSSPPVESLWVERRLRTGRSVVRPGGYLRPELRSRARQVVWGKIMRNEKKSREIKSLTSFTG